MYYCTISIIADQNGFISVVIGVYRYRTLQVVEDYLTFLSCHGYPVMNAERIYSRFENERFKCKPGFTGGRQY